MSDLNPDQERSEALAALAGKLKMQFDPINDFELAEKFSFLSWLHRGDVRYASNAFQGSFADHQVTVFDYHFTKIVGERGYEYYWSAFVVEVEANFPDLTISHESWESRLEETLGKLHLVFESADFTHAFRVRSHDKKFASDVCSPRMMEYLLANRDLTVEINGRGLALFFEDRLQPEKMEFNLSRLIEIRKLLPEYLFNQT